MMPFCSMPSRMATSLICILKTLPESSDASALCTAEHCRHAPLEMEDLDEAFQRLRSQMPGLPMPAFDRLYRQMPSWEQIRNTYKKEKLT